jgi:hypothetical protein
VRFRNDALSMRRSFSKSRNRLAAVAIVAHKPG